jgi:hypothetical protein
MAARRRVAFFLEDTAQEALIPALFRRLVEEEGYPTDQCEYFVLSARGGGSLKSLKQFLKDAKRRSHLAADVLVVGSDANCKGFVSRRDLISHIAAKSPFEIVIPAIPDPHIERWYLLDMQALRQASGVPIVGDVPAYKCDKHRYKILLRDAFRESGIIPPMGGIEYGELVAANMDLYSACKLDAGLAAFVDRVRSWIRQSGIS